MSSQCFNRSQLAAAVALTISALSVPGFADDSAGFTLEEIVVYAQKREQSIMEVPVSVSSYDSESLDRAQVRDVSDLQQVSPSLSVNSSSGGSESIFAIRGIGTAGNNAGLEQSVGVFIDGVYRGRPGSALSDYMDVDGIEVLKGPQGTIFGRNTSAGVISVRTAAPSYETAAGIEMSAGDDDYFQTKAYATGALIDDVLAYRIAASYQEKDGYIDDVVSGEDYNDKDRYSIRGQLLWDIDETKSLRLIADYSESDEKCCGGSSIFQAAGPASIISALGGGALPGNAGSIGGVAGTHVDTFDREAILDAGVENSMKDYGLSGEFNWEFENTELTVISSFRKFEDSTPNDADGSGIDLLVQNKQQEIDEKSIEIRLASTGSNTVDWMAGFYYFDQDIDYKHPLFWGDDARAYVDTLTGGLISAAEAGLNGSVTGEYLAGGDYTSTETDYSSESMALFGQATWNIDEQLSVTLGLRYSEEEKEGDYHWEGQHSYAELTGTQINTGLFNALQAPPASLSPVAAQATADLYTPTLQSLQIGTPYNDFTSKYDDDNISGTVSVNYLWNDDFSTYARFAQGYKAGGLNMDRTAGGQSGGNPAVNPDGAQFDPEEVESFEVGFKSRMLDGTLQLNGALFYQTLEDFQANSFDGIAFVVRNAAEVEGKGFELDYMYQPSENWVFSGGLVLQDIDYSDYKDASATQVQKNGGATTQDLTDKPVVFTSDVNYSGAISYTQPLNSSLDFNANTTYSYRSEYFTAQDNDPVSEQDGYWLFNASVGVAAQDGSWSVDLWGKNITDEEVLNITYDAFLQSNTYNAWVNAPRTVGVTGRLRF
jgi:iron complex outermembrane recepter protein